LRRLVLVSNRLPITVRSEHGRASVVRSSGGLASALRTPHELTGGLWVGWPGDVSRMSPSERAETDVAIGALNCVPVHLTPSEIAHYYDGFSNAVLWPLLHYRIDKVNLDAERDWTVYEAVNRRFAERVAAAWRPGDVVWVHDYQLALVPDMLRALVPNATIGFFLHVPFPPAELFNVLPWRSEIVRGILGADLVAFHTEGYRRNFCAAAAQLLGHEQRGSAVSWEGRVVRISVAPIGVDAAELEALASSAEVEREAARLVSDARGKRIILGVDRLDYSKGIPRRLLAYDRCLTRNPSLREKLLFIQLAVPTREKVGAYTELRRDVNELVGRINSHHGTATGGPLQLLYRSVPLTQLVALYRAAHVMAVTPLRDGMNLVAKEYVASRVDGDGVLVLSEFAGAAAQLREALVVNPYDLGAVSSAIVAALDMPEHTRRARMAALRTQVADEDVSAWVARSLEELDAARPYRDLDPVVPVASSAE
jgi:trehalose 6-phosphate synthase/phosphatase